MTRSHKFPNYQQNANTHKVSDLPIISGRFKGLRLASPHQKSTHPMGSREKLALFNMLASKLNGAKVLDVYAGSGALGLEALSRGALEVVFIESNQKVSNILRQNAETVLSKFDQSQPPSNENTTSVYTCTVQDFVKLSKHHEYFDIVIADPPYDNFNSQEIRLLFSYLKPLGYLVLSHPAILPTPTFPSVDILNSRKYAAARLTIYQKKP